MDDRRAKLVEKRRLAQVRRERQNVSATFRRVAPSLCEHGLRFSKLVPERCREALGTLASGPGRDERLLWGDVPGGTCVRWEDKARRDAHVRRALACCVAPTSSVVVIWHPFQAGLRLRAADLAAHAAPVLDAAGDTIWIVAAEGGPWLIEVVFWDREVCWAPNMPVFGD